jgi:hypothetical protein
MAATERVNIACNACEEARKRQARKRQARAKLDDVMDALITVTSTPELSVGSPEWLNLMRRLDIDPQEYFARARLSLVIQGLQERCLNDYEACLIMGLADAGATPIEKQCFEDCLKAYYKFLYSLDAEPFMLSEAANDACNNQELVEKYRGVAERVERELLAAEACEIKRRMIDMIIKVMSKEVCESDMHGVFDLMRTTLPMINAVRAKYSTAL